MSEVADIGNSIRQKVHELNNLIMIIEGNIKLMQCEDEEILHDTVESLKACKKIINSLYIAGRELNRIGAVAYGTDIDSRR